MQRPRHVLQWLPSLRVRVQCMDRVFPAIVNDMPRHAPDFQGFLCLPFFLRVLFVVERSGIYAVGVAFVCAICTICAICAICAI